MQMSDKPRAYLRWNWLRDAPKECWFYLHDSYKPLISAEPVHLVKPNEMLMGFTDFLWPSAALYGGQTTAAGFVKSSEDLLSSLWDSA